MPTASRVGLPDLRLEAPSDFGGPGDAWSPEHLLLVAVQSCFLLTLRAVARGGRRLNSPGSILGRPALWIDRTA